MPAPSDRPPEPSALDPTHFEELVAEHVRDPRVTKDLHVLLVRMGEVGDGFTERSAWLEDFGNWLHAGGSSGGAGWFGGSSNAERTRRLRAFILALSSVRGFRENFAALFTGVVRELRGTKLMADVGIPVEPGFWREAINRITQRLVPAPPVPKSFAHFIGQLFPTEAEAQWLESGCPEELWTKLWTILESTKTPLSTAWMPLAGSMADAMRILAARIAALGVAQDVRDRLPELPVAELPFLRLSQLCDAVQLGPPRLSTSNEGALAMIDECRRVLLLAHAHVEEYGVSVDLVYRLELMAAQLQRLEQLVSLLVPPSTDVLAGNLGRFTLSLVRAQFQGRSVLELLRTSSHLLARKVVERSGKSGEHYITETRREWRAMLVSAAGGGFLTAFTAALKVLTTTLALPVFFASLAASVNYAGSFLLMGALGFTLATKQPSMTAAALAASLESEDPANADVDPVAAVAVTAPTPRPPGSSTPPVRMPSMLAILSVSPTPPVPAIDRLVTLVAQISRSQLAAAIGNVGMVIPTALGFDWAWHRITGHPFLTPEKAHHVVESLQPLHSGTIVYAALTGVLLWLSSLGAGWLENWVVYRRLPEAIAQSRNIKRLLGVERAKRLAKAVDHGAASVGGSVTLGFLLGSVPTASILFGFPIDVRHVTLSTGSLVFAGASLGPSSVMQPGFIEAMVGIVVIGSLNFGVSFVLALAVAIRARPRWRSGAEHITRNLMRALAKRMLRSPFQFLFPPRSPKQSTGA